ncbi:hypothetical protein ACM43_11085 [Bradyrhizobium sp. CCBAU 45321]|nr:hypothetical protein [Bradyrhizobium sp. CCBAU 45321]
MRQEAISIGGLFHSRSVSAYGPIAYTERGLRLVRFVAPRIMQPIFFSARRFEIVSRSSGTGSSGFGVPVHRTR